jgi:hypothetical protein
VITLNANGMVLSPAMLGEGLRRCEEEARRIPTKIDADFSELKLIGKIVFSDSEGVILEIENAGRPQSSASTLRQGLDTLPAASMKAGEN